MVKILLDKGASLTDKVIELSKNVGNDIHLSWFFYWPSFFYLSVLIDLVDWAGLTDKVPQLNKDDDNQIGR